MLTNNVIFVYFCVLLLELVAAGTDRMLSFKNIGIDSYLITGHFLITNLNSTAIDVSSRCDCKSILSTLPDCKAVSTYFSRRKNSHRCRMANSGVELHQLRFHKWSQNQNYVSIIKDQLVAPFKFDTKGGFIYYEVQKGILTYDYETISSVCAVEGGRLPIIKTLTELEGYVEQRVALGNTDGYHGWMLGLSRTTSADPWMWDDGTLFNETEVSHEYGISKSTSGNRIGIIIQLPNMRFYASDPQLFWAFCQIDIFQE